MSALTTTSHPQQQIQAPPACYGELARELRYEAGRDTLTRLPTDEEHAVLKARYQHLMTALHPISYTAHGPALGLAGAAIAEMFQGFTGWKPEGADPRDPKSLQTAKQKAIGWYVHELGDLPLFAIEAACADVRAGRVPDLKPDWPPTTARMAQLARGHADPVSIERAITKRLLAVRDTRHEDNRSPEVVERISTGLRQLGEYLIEQATKEDKIREEKRTKETLQRTESMILREYRERGINPVYGPNNKPISISLLKFIESERAKKANPVDRTYRDEGS